MATAGIIMRTKNRPVLLKRAIESVCSQTLSDWELVIVNDGGDPSEVEALVEAVPGDLRRRITCLHHKQSKGMEAASNAGLRALSSRYVLIHDDDDSLFPDFLARTTAYLEAPPHPSVKGVVTGTERVYEVIEGQTVRETSRHPYNDWLSSISLRRMLVENVFAPIAFLFDREACLEVGAFREDLPVLGDWDFNVRFLTKYEIGLLPDVLARYHDRHKVTDGDYSSSVKGKARLHAFYDNFLRNEWLREDIARGRTGPGIIATQALMQRDLVWDLKQILKKNPFKLFKSRKK
jgi:glycosyltransferase involved in cell wall biosynthesis